MATITTINATDKLSDSRGTINTNISNLNTEKIERDGSVAFTGEQSMGSNKLTNVTDPTAAQDAATKAYVDSNAGGFHQGFMTNGKIVPSVSSNNLTVALKTLAGTDPSASDPVKIRIGDTVRSITSALSVTKNAGTNWCNSGSSELATQLIDYFVYLGYNATDGVVIGFTRIPSASRYADFSATTTNEKYCAISNISNADSGDEYEVIGRFGGYLSAGAGYTWSLAPLVGGNIIQRPIYETRWLTYTPQHSASGSMTYTSISVAQAQYKVSYDKCTMIEVSTGTLGGTASVAIYSSTPFTVNGNGRTGGSMLNNNTQYAGPIRASGTSIEGYIYNGANWTLSANSGMSFELTFKI